MKRAVVGIASLSVALALLLGVSGTAWSVEKFFEGKTIRFIVGGFSRRRLRYLYPRHRAAHQQAFARKPDPGGAESDRRGAG